MASYLRLFAVLLGWMVLCLMLVAISRGDDSALREQLNELLSRLLSTQQSVQHKDLHILKLDDTISDLQKQLEMVKAAELGAKLEKKEVELFDLRGKINDLQLDIDRQTSEFQYLETVAVGLQKQREEAKHVLHSVEDLILNIQAEIELKDQDIHKMHTLWLPHWVNEAIAYWQVVLSTGVSMLWKKVAYIAASTYKKLHDTKLSKNLDAVEVQVLSYMHRMKEILEERVHALWRSCNIFSRESVTAFEKALYQPHYFLQHPVVKLKQFFSNVLKYGISLHLELQRRVRTALQKNGFLAFAYSWEVVWFLASALLILPLCGLLLLSSFWG